VCRRVDVASLLEPRVPGDADARELSDLLAAKLCVPPEGGSRVDGPDRFRRGPGFVGHVVAPASVIASCLACCCSYSRGGMSPSDSCSRGLRAAIDWSYDLLS
jgi:hypothetical protein